VLVLDSFAIAAQVLSAHLLVRFPVILKSPPGLSRAICRQLGMARHWLTVSPPTFRIQGRGCGQACARERVAPGWDR
jgi:hypothetical protein